MRPKRYVRARTIRRALASALAVSYGIRSAGYVPPKIARRAMRDPAYFELLAKALMYRQATSAVDDFASSLDRLGNTLMLNRRMGETDEQFRERMKLLLSSA